MSDQSAQDRPVPTSRLLRNLMSGIVGQDLGDSLVCLERRTVRAIQARRRKQRRDDNLTEQARLRAEAVARRIKHRMLAAEYARDRRASGTTGNLSKRQIRKLRTEERVAQKRQEEVAHA